MGTRRAVVIGVGEFKGFPALPFAEELANRAAQRYIRLGFGRVEPVRHPDRQRLKELLDDLQAPGEATILHYVGHGAVGAGPGSYYVAASDSVDDPDDYAATCVDLGAIINDLIDRAGCAPVLVVLDAYAAEAVSRQALEGSAKKRAGQRIWVIAASAQDQKAYRGRLTEAVIAVLAEVERGDFHLAGEIEFVPLDRIFERIAEHVEWLCGRDAQPVPGVPVDGALPEQKVQFWRAGTGEAPFFRNKDFTVAEQQAAALLRQVVPDIELQKVLDTLARDANPAHFLNVARGASRQLRPGERLCYFSGRRSILDRVSQWLRAEHTPLCVVTGSPGVGKSAVLGVLACGLHPTLREIAQDVVPSLPEEFFLPAEEPDIAVVHARGKDVHQILAAIAGQLRLGEAARSWWSTAEVSDRLTREQRRPLIIVDGIDEANNLAGIVTGLALPLLNKGACRLLAAVREERAAAALLTHAREHGLLINLDEADTAELASDLSDYVTVRLEGVRGYEKEADRREVATVVSDGLVRRERRLGGEFLAVQIVTERLVEESVPLTSLGDIMPSSLTELFAVEIDRMSRGRPWFRAVLAALAWAKGNGMSVEVIRLVAKAFQPPNHPEIAGHEVDIVLDAARTYLRRGAIFDGTVVYQFRSDAFASHMRSQPYQVGGIGSVRAYAGDVLDALLDALPTRSGSRRWHCATPTVLPYLLRHVIEHASDAGQVAKLLSDPEFLVYADPDTLRGHLDDACSADGATGAELYRAAWDELRAFGPEDRRQILAITAARMAHARGQSSDFLDWLARGPGVGWPVRWVRGSFSTQVCTDTPDPVLGRCVTLIRTVGGSVAVFGCSDGRIRRWDLATDRISESQPIQPLAQPGGIPRGPQPNLRQVAAGHVGDRTIVVTGGEDGAIRFWDLDSLEEIRPPQGAYIEDAGFEHRHPEITALTVTSLNGREVAVAGAHR